MNTFVARQPVIGHDQRLFAYELLFRSSLENYFPGIDGNAASSHVIAHSLSVFGPDSGQTVASEHPLPTSELSDEGMPLPAGRRFRLGGSNLRRAGLIGTIAFVGLLSAALVLFVARGNDAGAVTSGGETGFLKIVAYPWAEIYVDGLGYNQEDFCRLRQLNAI